MLDDQTFETVISSAPLISIDLLVKKDNKIPLPNCEKISRIGIDIPSSIKLSENDVDYIVKNLKIIAKKLLN